MTLSASIAALAAQMRSVSDAQRTRAVHERSGFAWWLAGNAAAWETAADALERELQKINRACAGLGEDRP